MISFQENEFVKALAVAHTPDPDDAFAWWAIASGRLRLPDYRFRVDARPIQQINEACLCSGAYEVAAISSAAWPALSRDYAILSSGASVGRHYGPALVTRGCLTIGQLAGKTVAIPGEATTGALLLRLFFPDVRTIELPFDRVGEAIARGEVDAGVMIHEELLNYEYQGLTKLACLGKMWCEATDLPIPVGLNVIRRDLGEALMLEVAHLVQESMVLAQMNREEATRWAMGYSIERASGIGEKFLKMFANQDTLLLAPQCRMALRELYRRAFAAGLIPCEPELDIVEIESAFTLATMEG